MKGRKTMAKTNKVMIQVCLCGAGTKKAQAPTVPYTAEELADQIVECAKAGASIAHIHVREDKIVDGVMQIGYKSMSLQKFTEAVEVTREKCKKAGVDILINSPHQAVNTRTTSASSILAPCCLRCVPSTPTPSTGQTATSSRTAPVS
jgi:uncharacterized protein (DUF849 family)